MLHKNTTYSFPNYLFYGLGKLLFRAYFACFGGVEVIGWERVPSKGPLLLAATHSSLADPWLMLVASRRPFRSMAARELFSIWWLAWFLKLMGAFPVTRGVQDTSALAQTRRRLGEGGVILIFPEGRCSPGPEGLPLLPGVALMSLRTGVPVVPVGIRGNRELLPLGARWPRRAHVQVEFGWPIEPPQNLTPVRLAVSRHLESISKEIQTLRG